MFGKICGAVATGSFVTAMFYIVKETVKVLDTMEKNAVSIHPQNVVTEYIKACQTTNQLN